MPAGNKRNGVTGGVNSLMLSAAAILLTGLLAAPAFAQQAGQKTYLLAGGSQQSPVRGGEEQR